MDSNHRPHAYQACALTGWAISPFQSGSHLLSHTVTSIVSSAAFVLTIVFGMWTGVSQKRIATGKIELDNSTVKNSLLDFLRKEVIQPHLPIRLPCYDFTPVIEPAFGSSLLAVGSLTSGISNSHGAVSYTHLDVYKRQNILIITYLKHILPLKYQFLVVVFKCNSF